MAVTVDSLALVPVFGELASSTLELLAQHAILISRETGEVFYEQNTPPSGLYVLQTGCVKLYRQSKDRAQILSLVMPGECFGAESLPNNTPSPCTATALTPTTAIYVPPDNLLDIIAACSDFQIMLLDLVSARLKQYVSLVHNLAFRDVAARLAMVLLTRAETEGELTDEGIRMDRLLTQQELAAMVGTAREVIHRTFKKFERDGVARITRKHIFILDADKLAEIANLETR